MTSKSSRRVVIVGLVLMVGGVLDPLEGSVVILGGTALAALGAFLGRSRYWVPVIALVMTTAGVAALLGLSALGGVGGTTGRSAWWLLLCITYPAGWILGLVGAARTLRALRHSAA